MLIEVYSVLYSLYNRQKENDRRAIIGTHLFVPTLRFRYHRAGSSYSRVKLPDSSVRCRFSDELDCKQSRFLVRSMLLMEVSAWRSCHCHGSSPFHLVFNIRDVTRAFVTVGSLVKRHRILCVSPERSELSAASPLPLLPPSLLTTILRLSGTTAVSTIVCHTKYSLMLYRPSLSPLQTSRHFLGCIHCEALPSQLFH